MVHRLPLTKARINLGQVVKRAHVNKEYFILEKDGIPVAGILDADELEDYLELQDLRFAVRFTRATPTSPRAGSNPPRTCCSRAPAGKR